MNAMPLSHSATHLWDECYMLGTTITIESLNCHLHIPLFGFWRLLFFSYNYHHDYEYDVVISSFGGVWTGALYYALYLNL